MDLSNMKKNVRKYGQWGLLVAVMFCICFALISTHQLNQSIEMGNRKIVLNYGNQVAARIHDLLERIDISLMNLNNQIQREDDESMEMMSFYLDGYKDTWEMDATGLLYEDKSGCLSDGTDIVFGNEISLLDVQNYSHKIDISRQNINGQEMLVFCKPCECQVEGKAVSGIFSAMKVERLETLLGDYGYSSESFMVLTQSDGENIWKQREDISGIDSNCFEELEQRTTIGKSDSILQMQTRMTVAMDGTISYSHNGQDYYMAYVPLGVNYWYLLVSAESDSIDLTEISRQHFYISTILVGAILIMSVVCIIYLFQRNRSISRYNKQLQVANKAKQDNQAKQEFLAKVSHDIRTPLNGVMGMVTLAKEEYSNQEKCMEYLDKATVSAKYLLGLLNDVLDMSQIESGKVNLIEETVDLKELLKEIETILEISAGEKGLYFSLDDSELKHQYFKGDKLRLKQILMNLCSNAVKYTGTGGWIRLEVEEIVAQEQTKLIFKIRDNGEGIAPDKLVSIFKPFEQVSAKRQGGVGLGLSIVHNFVERMGGHITVESKIGTGSLFTVTLPLNVVEQPQIVLKEQPCNNLQGVLVLLAEDNQVNAEIAIFMLKKYGAIVKHVWDGKEAVEEFEKSSEGAYQIILMDIQMPKMDGLEATRRIRNMNRADATKIPILSMTANAFSEQKKEMLQAGMNDFLYKPIDINMVCSCINKWIREE